MSERKNPNGAWFLLPIFLGIIGSIIIHIMFHGKNREFVKASWIIGILLTLLGIFVI